MVLVRRKSDGLYYTNRGQSRRYGRVQTGWTNNPQACKPFANVGGAHGSFNHYVPYDRCTCGKKGLYGASCYASCYRFKESRRWFDEHYTIVPVHVKVDV